MKVRLEPGSKVNLLLRVGPPAADGFHPLLTLFAALDLCDRLDVEFGGEGLHLQVLGAELGRHDENLVVRVLREAPALLGIPPIGAQATLVKRVPHQAGLGGGSADAAATLRALVLHAGSGDDPTRLEQVASAFGSDVPFFLRGGFAVGRGRGTALTSVRSEKQLPLLIVKPTIGSATAAAYQALDAARPAHPGLGEEAEAELVALRGALEDPATGPAKLAPLLANDFHEVLVPASPELRAVEQALLVAGARRALLCGSGAALFGLFASAATRDRAADQLREACPDAAVFAVSAGVAGLRETGHVP